MKQTTIYDSSACTRRIFVELRSVDVLVLAFFGLLVALETMFRSNLPGWDVRIMSALLLAAGYTTAIALLGRAGNPSGSGPSIVRIALVMAVSSAIYDEVGHLIYLVFPFSWDTVIHSFDAVIFGRMPTLWFGSFAEPWLTEIMMFAYVIYLPLLPAVAYLAFRHAGREGMERYLFELTLANFLCYLGYFLLPVSGPSRALAGEFSGPLAGYFFTSVTAFMAGNIHLPGGAFPSAHCAASTIFLLVAWRHNRKAGLLVSPVVALIYISTVYGRFHYVVDAVAGILLAIAVYRIAPALMLRCDRWVFGLAFAKKSGPAFLNLGNQRGESS